MRLAKEIYNGPLRPMHRDNKTHDLPPSCDLWHGQAFPWPASYPEQGEIEKSLVQAGVLPTTQNPLTAATATESGLLDCTILLLEGIRVHTTWPLSGCARATGSACVRPTNERLPQSAFSFELHRQRIYSTSQQNFTKNSHKKDTCLHVM